MNMKTINLLLIAAVTMQLNGSDAAYPLAANAWEEFGIGEGVTSVVFNLTSSASNAKTKVNVLSY